MFCTILKIERDGRTNSGTPKWRLILNVDSLQYPLNTYGSDIITVRTRGNTDQSWAMSELRHGDRVYVILDNDDNPKWIESINKVAKPSDIDDSRSPFAKTFYSDSVPDKVRDALVKAMEDTTVDVRHSFVEATHYSADQIIKALYHAGYAIVKH